jgi:hypothetical protein
MQPESGRLSLRTDAGATLYSHGNSAADRLALKRTGALQIAYPLHGLESSIQNGTETGRHYSLRPCESCGAPLPQKAAIR